MTSGTDFRFNFAEPANNNETVAASAVDSTVFQPVEPKESSFNSNLLAGSGTQFKFNFTIDDAPEDINIAGLAINS